MTGHFPSTLLDNVGGALLIAGSVTLRPLVLRSVRRWGATDRELSAPLPGDSLVPSPRYAITQAVTIEAPPEEVFPWLRQLGQGRGGLYSYELLENLARCEIHNASTIVPEWQTLEVGDPVRFGPEGFPHMLVASLDPPRSLVLETPPNPMGAKGSWALVLEPVGARATRFLSRYRGAHAGTLKDVVVWEGLTEPINAVMARAMLLGVKARAEATSGSPTPGA